MNLSLFCIEKHIQYNKSPFWINILLVRFFVLKPTAKAFIVPLLPCDVPSRTLPIFSSKNIESSSKNDLVHRLTKINPQSKWLCETCIWEMRWIRPSNPIPASVRELRSTQYCISHGTSQGLPDHNLHLKVRGSQTLVKLQKEWLEKKLKLKLWENVKVLVTDL